MSTIQNILTKAKLLGSKLYSLSPFGVGVALGYIFKPELKLGVDVVVSLVKALFKL